MKNMEHKMLATSYTQLLIKRANPLWPYIQYSPPASIYITPRYTLLCTGITDDVLNFSDVSVETGRFLIAWGYDSPCRYHAGSLLDWSLTALIKRLLPARLFHTSEHILLISCTFLFWLSDSVVRMKNMLCCTTHTCQE